jgi:hypothetical protein
MEGGMGIIDIGETAVVHIQFAKPLNPPGAFGGAPSHHKSGKNVYVLRYGRDAETYEGDSAEALYTSKTSSSPFIHVITIDIRRLAMRRLVPQVKLYVVRGQSMYHTRI